MMSKIKKALIAAGVFIVVGISGSIVSGFYVVPQVASEVYKVQREIRNATPQEREVFVTSDVVEALDIESLEHRGFDVEIVPSSDGNTRVKVNEFMKESINVSATYDSEGKKLILTGERDIYDFLEAENLKGFIEKGYEAAIGTLMDEANKGSEIIVEVPTGVDISFKGNYNNNLTINDNAVLKDNLYFSCGYGYANLPINNTLKNIDIRTNAYLEMDVREFINADKVNIEGSSVYIDSRGNRDEYNSITKLPESINIYAMENMGINSYIPLGKEVLLTGSYISYKGNFENHPVNLNLRGRGHSNAYYSDRIIDDENFQGILGSGEASEYNLIISRYYNCDIENLSDFEIETRFR